MELNWSTLLLEIVNFLVLVWILKRFLYRPVLQVIEERRSRHRGDPDRGTAAPGRRPSRLRGQYENRSPIGNGTSSRRATPSSRRFGNSAAESWQSWGGS